MRTFDRIAGESLGERLERDCRALEAGEVIGKTLLTID
jgi:hypothetical protein